MNEYATFTSWNATHFHALARKLCLAKVEDQILDVYIKYNETNNRISGQQTIVQILESNAGSCVSET